jgi:hypothetical protein
MLYVANVAGKRYTHSIGGRGARTHSMYLLLLLHLIGIRD